MEVSRQRKWQLKKMAEGLCSNCGRKRDCESTTNCYSCLVKNRIKNRKLVGSKPQEETGLGRTAFEFTPTAGR